MTRLTYAEVPTDCRQITGAAAAGGLMFASYFATLTSPEILYADAFHNDPASPPCQWVYYKSGLEILIGDLAPLAPGVRRALYRPSFPGPIYLNENSIRFRAPAGATAGCVITINFVMRQPAGVR
jgi:hypothetical protein